MDVKKAAQKSLDLYWEYISVHPSKIRHSAPMIRVGHLRDMNEKIQSGEVQGEKAHRWLGWIQAAVYAHGCASLEDLKLINKQS